MILSIWFGDIHGPKLYKFTGCRHECVDGVTNRAFLKARARPGARGLAGRTSGSLALNCSINSFRFLSFLLWFVLGPGGFREAPGGPGKAHGGLRDPPGPGPKNIETNTFCRSPLSGRVRSCRAQTRSKPASGPAHWGALQTIIGGPYRVR